MSTVDITWTDNTIASVLSDVPLYVNYYAGGELFVTEALAPGYYTVSVEHAAVPVSSEILTDTYNPLKWPVNTFHSLASENQFLVFIDQPVRGPATPEASTWTMLALGFAMLGAIAFRRRKSLPCLM